MVINDKGNTPSSAAKLAAVSAIAAAALLVINNIRSMIMSDMDTSYMDYMTGGERLLMMLISIIPVLPAVGFVLFAVAAFRNSCGRLALISTIVIMVTMMAGGISGSSSMISFYDAEDTLSSLVTLYGIAFKTMAFAVLIIYLSIRLKDGRVYMRGSKVILMTAVPAGLFIIGMIINSIAVNTYLGYFTPDFLTILSGVANLAFIIGATMWFTGWFDEHLQVRYDIKALKDASTFINRTDLSINIIIHAILLLFTMKVWQFICIYRMTGYLNRARDGRYMTPLCQVLLCMIPFYGIYWIYRNSKKIDMLMSERGMRSNSVMPGVLLSIFLPSLMTLPMQILINRLTDIEDMNTAPAAPEPQQAPAENIAAAPEPQQAPAEDIVAAPEPQQAPAEDIVAAPEPQQAPDPAESELAGYRELLELGIITEEEYEMKKKEIMGE